MDKQKIEEMDGITIKWIPSKLGGLFISCEHGDFWLDSPSDEIINPQPESQWISVEDDLPEEGVLVLINVYTHGVLCGWWNDNTWWLAFDVPVDEFVNLWQPLPSKPED